MSAAPLTVVTTQTSRTIAQPTYPPSTMASRRISLSSSDTDEIASGTDHSASDSETDDDHPPVAAS